MMCHGERDMAAVVGSRAGGCAGQTCCAGEDGLGPGAEQQLGRSGKWAQATVRRDRSEKSLPCLRLGGVEV